jgi:hypothetical protein
MGEVGTGSAARRFVLFWDSAGEVAVFVQELSAKVDDDHLERPSSGWELRRS